MKQYLVKIIVETPYPREITARIDCSNHRTAVGRAITALRLNPLLKGKKINQMRIVSTKI